MIIDEKSLDLYRGKTKIINKAQKRYRLMGIMIFCVACGLLIARIITGLLSTYIESDLGLDALFSLLAQVLVLLVMPVLFYLFAFKQKPKEILAFSNFKKTNWYNYVLAAAIGICAMFVTVGISTVWQTILILFGYTHSPSPDTLPETFNLGIFLLSLFLTAVLPGVCEEFTMRGGYLTTMRKSYKYKTTLLIMAISFGLFHQYITQVFYTALFGLLMAAIVLKTKSIFPAMIIHFFNNGTSVYLESAEKYHWWGGEFYNNLDIALTTNGFFVFLAYVAICSVFAGLIILFWRLNSNNRLEKKKDVILSSGFDVTHGKVVLIGEENKELVKDLGLEKEVYGGKVEETLYKPTLRDNAFFIGAIIVASLTTIFSFIWGWMV